MLLISLSILGAGVYAINKTAAECRVSRESKKGVGWQLTSVEVWEAFMGKRKSQE